MSIPSGKGKGSLNGGEDKGNEKNKAKEKKRDSTSSKNPDNGSQRKSISSSRRDSQMKGPSSLAESQQPTEPSQKSRFSEVQEFIGAMGPSKDEHPKSRKKYSLKNRDIPKLSTPSGKEGEHLAEESQKPPHEPTALDRRLTQIQDILTQVKAFATGPFKDPKDPKDPKEPKDPNTPKDRLATTVDDDVAIAITPSSLSFGSSNSRLDRNIYEVKSGKLGYISSTYLPRDTARRDKTKVPLKSYLHEIMYDFVESSKFSNFILAIILLNTLVLIIQTWQEYAIRFDWYFTIIDCLFLGIYLMEAILKIYVYRGAYFLEGWNILDFVIVVSNVIDFGLPLIVQNLSGGGVEIFRILRVLRGFRAARSLRVLKAIRFLSNLQVIVSTIMQSIKSIGAIVSLIALFMYMFAVIGRVLYSESNGEFFGNILISIFTLFQLLTLDNWFEIYQKTLENNKDHWHIMIFLVGFIVVEYFVFLNLFVAVLVDNFQLSLEAQSEATKARKRKLVESFDLTDVEGDLSSTDITGKKKEEKDYYKYMNTELKSKIHHFCHMMASIEYNGYSLHRQQAVLDKMVDMCSDNAIDTFAKDA